MEIKKNYRMYICPNCEEPNSCNGYKCPYCNFESQDFKKIVLNSEKDKFKAGFYKLSESIDELQKENKSIIKKCEQEKQDLVNKLILKSKEITRLKQKGGRHSSQD